MLAAFRSGFDRTARLEGFVDAVLIGALDTVGTGGYVRLLLRGATQLGEDNGSGSAISTPEDSSKLSEDTFCKVSNRY